MNMRCEDNSKLRLPLNEVCRPTEIGSVPLTTGVPSEVPTPDQLPLAYDRATGILYFYTNQWNAFGLNALSEVNLANVTNLENVLRIPLSYDAGGQQVEGYITLKELKTLL